MNALNFAKKIFSGENILSFEQVSAFKKMHKIVVYVPDEKVDEVAFSMANVGAGKIGNYSSCSFRTKGVGTFLGSKNTNPAVGEKGNFEKVDEIRLEMVCEPKFLNKVIHNMLKVHPYEEPAYEIYDIVIGEKMKEEKALLVNLKKPLKVNDVIGKLSKKLDLSLIKNNLLNKKFDSAHIDLSGKELNFSTGEIKNNNCLNIHLSKQGEYKISFK